AQIEQEAKSLHVDSRSFHRGEKRCDSLLPIQHIRNLGACRNIGSVEGDISNASRSRQFARRFPEDEASHRITAIYAVKQITDVRRAPYKRTLEGRNLYPTR